MERIAEMQMKINADRRMIARRVQQQHRIDADTTTSKNSNATKLDLSLPTTSLENNTNGN